MALSAAPRSGRTGALLLVVLAALSGCAAQPARRGVPPGVAAGHAQASGAEGADAAARRTARSRRTVTAIDQPVAVAPVDGLALAPVRRAPSALAPRGAPRLAWPIEGGTVSSRYGRRGRRHHDGIDISSPIGTRVLAAADGVVVYAASLRGYGRMIIVRHPRGYDTVYAHNARHFVARGARVRRGQAIASVGRTGRTTGPNLHFEVRKDNVAHDPLRFLSPRPDAVAQGE